MAVFGAGLRFAEIKSVVKRHKKGLAVSFSHFRFVHVRIVLFRFIGLSASCLGLKPGCDRTKPTSQWRAHSNGFAFLSHLEVA